MIHIRKEQEADIGEVFKINLLAFETKAEAEIVDFIRSKEMGLLSLVAEFKGRVVGHILFSRVTLDNHPELHEGMGLAPMAVHPDHQNLSIGSRLIETGLEILKKENCPYIIVLGHPEYYPRFGFTSASGFNLKSQWSGVPDEAFMVLELQKGFLKDKSGIARYLKVFDEAI